MIFNKSIITCFINLFLISIIIFTIYHVHIQVDEMSFQYGISIIFVYPSTISSLLVTAPLTLFWECLLPHYSSHVSLVGFLAILFHGPSLSNESRSGYTTQSQIITVLPCGIFHTEEESHFLPFRLLVPATMSQSMHGGAWENEASRLRKGGKKNESGMCWF